MLLSHYMELRHLTDAELATKVGCSESAIYKLRVQQNRPSLETAYQIEQLTRRKVGLADWQYEPKNRFWNKRMKSLPSHGLLPANGKASRITNRGPAAAPPARKRKADGGASLQAR